ncbi:MAG: OsmC family protein [Bacteroidetes bacterium]|nr:OsmC family protein [Bacteroidota bacterium]
MKRKATAKWIGNGPEGKGTLTSVSGVLNNTPYSFLTRFKNEDGLAGTNPEELIAAAHSGCYAMALSFLLTKEGIVPEELNVTAAVSIELITDHFEITHIQLDLTGVVPGITPDRFAELANVAKANCPVSMALKAVEITLSVQLAE